MKNFYFGILVLLFLALIGCSNTTQTPTPDTQISIDSYPSSYPNADAPESAYPVSDTSTAQDNNQESVIQSEQNESNVTTIGGTIIGSLNLHGDNAVIPVANARLYLARVLIDDSGSERAAGFDRVNSPTTTTNSLGEFVFQGVQPGRYGLVLDTIMNSYLLLTPGQTDGLIITVVEGETTDVGELIYNELPLTSQP